MSSIVLVYSYVSFYNNYILLKSENSHSESTDDNDRQLSYSLSSTVENCSTETTSDSSSLVKLRSMPEIIKKYECKHEETK
jgi:hypothetical protein